MLTTRIGLDHPRSVHFTVVPLPVTLSIPIVETIEPDNDISMEGWTQCGPFAEWTQQVYESDAYRKMAEENADFLAELPKYMDNRPATFENMWNVSIAELACLTRHVITRKLHLSDSRLLECEIDPRPSYARESSRGLPRPSSSIDKLPPIRCFLTPSAGRYRKQCVGLSL